MPEPTGYTPPNLADVVDLAADLASRAITLDTAPAVMARAQVVQALAAVEQARAAQLAAVLAFLAAATGPHPTVNVAGTEGGRLMATARVLAGLTAEPEARA